MLELKRDKTPRDIVAQVLDYGAWVRTLDDGDIAAIFEAYRQKHHPDQPSRSINEAFSERFGMPAMPEELNEVHELVIVASRLDPASERIVDYLAEQYDVNINAVFFRCFKDEDREYLTRAWLRPPGFRDLLEAGEAGTGGGPGGGPGPKGPWNGEYYVSYGVYPHRRWEDAQKYGYIAAGGGSWYTNTLQMLSPGDRVWVNVPGHGYVGVGTVKEPVVPITECLVDGPDGQQMTLMDAPTEAPAFGLHPEKMEHIVRVDWIKTVPLNGAIKEKGFFGNQNTVAAPKAAKWEHTVRRLKQRFGIA
ncbi:MAG: nuclease [Planctomycetota bacterium]